MVGLRVVVEEEACMEEGRLLGEVEEVVLEVVPVPGEVVFKVV